VRLAVREVSFLRGGAGEIFEGSGSKECLAWQRSEATLLAKQLEPPRKNQQVPVCEIKFTQESARRSDQFQFFVQAKRMNKRMQNSKGPGDGEREILEV